MIESQQSIIGPLIRVDYSDIKCTDLHGIEFNIEVWPIVYRTSTYCSRY